MDILADLEDASRSGDLLTWTVAVAIQIDSDEWAEEARRQAAEFQVRKTWVYRDDLDLDDLLSRLGQVMGSHGGIEAPVGLWPEASD